MSTLLLFWLFLFAAPVPHTATQNPADLCTIQGVVVKGGTGEPLRKATVEAWLDNKGTGSEVAATETDAMGRFELTGLVPGEYTLTAHHNGFLYQEYGQHTPDGPGKTLTLSRDQNVSDITFQLIPAAVITGHVYDEDGEPVVGVQAWAMHRTYEGGQLHFDLASPDETNDLGEFRLPELSPGKYVVEVTLRFNESAKANGRRGYVPTYYPEALAANRATPVAVRAGDEISGIDISLQPVHTVAIRGNIINAGCGAVDPVGFVFLTGEDSNVVLAWQHFARATNAHGAFELPSVPAGSYSIYALLSVAGKTRCVSREPLEVGDTDIEGLALTASPGVEIKGRLRVEGQLDSNLRSFEVSLSPPDPYLPIGRPPNDSVKPDGSFLLKNAHDGNYHVNIYPLPRDYFIKSARLDGVDVLTAGVTVDGNHTPGLLEIVVSPNGATLDGVVSQDHKPFPGATVALAPDPPYRGDMRLFQSTTTDQNGHFVLQCLPPGDYKVFAWEKIERGAYTSSEFLQPFELRGESIHLTEGSRNSVQVDLIPAKDSGP